MIDRDLKANYAEAAIVAAAMANAADADAVVWLRPEDYGHPLLAAMWGAIQALRSERRPCDSSAIYSEMQRRGRGGLLGKDPSARWQELQQWARIARETDGTLQERAREVREAAARRELLARAERLAEAARTLSTPLDVLQADATALVTAAGDRLSVSRSVTAAVAVREAWQEIEAIQRGERPAGLTTGFPRLDGALGGGLRAGDLATIGAMPGGGKSAWALRLAIQHAWNGRRVHLVSAEMPHRAVATRALSAMTGIDTRGMRRLGGLSLQQRTALAEREREVEEKLGTVLTIDDHSRTAADACAEARRLHAQSRLALVIVDHLHALQLPLKVESTEKGVQQMVREIRDLALGLEIPVLMLAQYNRGVHQRNRPTMHDFKESSAIEQWSTFVGLLHEPDSSARDAEIRTVDLLVEKNRDGIAGIRIPYRYHARIHRFEEVQDDPGPAEPPTPAAGAQDTEGPEF